MQQKWVSKLLSYDFLVEYKKGQENKVADALSRRNEEDEPVITLSVISYPTLEWLIDLKESYLSDPILKDLVRRVQEGLLANTKFFFNKVFCCTRNAYTLESL
jgi:hypothetical protein